MLEDFLAQLDLGYFEVGEAFGGLADENVWKRPAPGLLSIGELAGHIAYSEAVRMAVDRPDLGFRPDLAHVRIKSPLVDERFSYYPGTLETPPSDEHLAMGAHQVHEELLRVHQEAVYSLRSLSPDLASPAPGWHSDYASYLRYAAFHVAYHTGQMYSVRHLFGETTPDN
jgi:hypothetical protein